jgi:hypothetical protein
MRKYIWMILLSLLSSTLYAIEIQIKPDDKITVSTGDVNALKSYLKKKYRFHISEKGAKKVVKENRILANEYLRQGLFRNDEKKRLQIEIETRFADEFVEHLQRKIKISPEVVKSYYYDHLDEYKESDEVGLERFRFKNFQDAMKFYEEASSQPDERERILSKYNGKKIYKGEVKKERLRESISSFITKDAVGTFLPPMIGRADAVDVYYVYSYRPAKGHKPFEKVKKEIEDLLYKKTFAKEREKILSKYLQEEDGE